MEGHISIHQERKDILHISDLSSTVHRTEIAGGVLCLAGIFFRGGLGVGEGEEGGKGGGYV